MSTSLALKVLYRVTLKMDPFSCFAGEAGIKRQLERNLVLETRRL